MKYLLIFLCLAALGCQQEPTAPVAKQEPRNEQPKPGEPPLREVKYKERIYQLEDLEVVQLRAAGSTIDAWVMDTPAKRQEGMMFLKAEDVADNQGMIFAFEEEQPASNTFWMANTPLALDIIFISKDKKVVSVKEGQPYSESPVGPTGPYVYVLELKQGQAVKLGIKPGTTVEIPSTIKGSG